MVAVLRVPPRTDHNVIITRVFNVACVDLKTATLIYFTLWIQVRLCKPASDSDEVRSGDHWSICHSDQLLSVTYMALCERQTTISLSQHEALRMCNISTRATRALHVYPMPSDIRKLLLLCLTGKASTESCQCSVRVPRCNYLIFCFGSLDVS